MTEVVLEKVHIFPSMESYNQNSENIGINDIALVPNYDNANTEIESAEAVLAVM